MDWPLDHNSGLGPSPYTNEDINDSDKYYQFYEMQTHPFSKFYPAKIRKHNVEYKTVEHYYQCQKFITTNPQIYNMILNAETIQSAHLLGQNKKFIRDDWFKINKQVYYEGQKTKFEQHPKLKQILMETNNKHIICIDPVEFWGLSVKPQENDEHVLNGHNNAGKLLNQIRNEFVTQAKENEEKQNDNNSVEDIYEFYEVYSHPFSKFYPAKITIDNIDFLTVEHYYQSQKYVNSDPSLYKLILNAKTIQDAHFLGQNTTNIRSDWFAVNKDIYCKGQKAKFNQYKELKKQLLGTDKKQIRCIDSDKFWGMSVDQNDNSNTLKGQNMSGILLCKIRDELLMESQQILNDQKDDLLGVIEKTIQFVSE
eukprot:179274_1